jgi:hypothetical protein
MAFIYYWIPTKTHIELKKVLKHRGISSKTRNLPDIQPDNRFEITVSVDDSTLDCSIILLRQETVSNIELHCKKDDSNGFIIYEITKSNEELNNLLQIQIYHLLKDFFHSHEFHAPENDGQLKAYISDRADDMEGCLRHYGELYIKKFEAYKKLFDSEKAEKIWQNFLNDRLLKKGVDKIARIERLLRNTGGEMVYVRFLLSSMIHYDNTDDVYRHTRAHLKVFENEMQMLQTAYESGIKPNGRIVCFRYP